ncbi:hypothetical protein AB0O52_10020 [Arthrobacter sp. NPDC080073]|uniref:hypothetical protein n=1 Tax=Arthrobacter sp. NPDC080073 TaxID=3155919 RepID=UPI00342272A1
MNFDVGQAVPNLVIVPVGADGTVSFTNNSAGTVQLIADTSGYSTAPATGQPGPHRLQSMASTPATGTPATNTFTWDAAGRMTGRAGETLSYAPDGKLATATGTSSLPVNPNPSATAGTPAAPVTGTAGSTGTRYYDGAGNLVGLTDGTGTTVALGSITAHSTPAGVQTATKSCSARKRSVPGAGVGQRSLRPRARSDRVLPKRWACTAFPWAGSGRQPCSPAVARPLVRGRCSIGQGFAA